MAILRESRQKEHKKNENPANIGSAFVLRLGSRHVFAEGRRDIGK